MNVWLNVAAFQLGWFACVISGARGVPSLGVAVALAVIALHLYFAPKPRQEVVLILFAAVFGFIADTVLIQVGSLEFQSGTIVSGTAPYWMVALWMMFATTINVSLAWLKTRRWFSAALGLLGGPLAYYAGERLGAVILDSPERALIAVAVVWCIAMPTLLAVADRYNGLLAKRQATEVGGV